MTELISFDYAIKYLLKHKGDHEIVEGFVSSILKTQGYNDVKIIALLDTESNKEERFGKRSLADLVVEDAAHHKYIIEIERDYDTSFAHKACFNTSRLIVDHIGEGTDYTKIVKVFHISLLYFKIGSGAINHGKTIFSNVETKERLTIHFKDPDTKETMDATNVFPEYFFVSVPLFDGNLETEMDDWLYVLKNSRVPPTPHSPYMQKVADRLNVLKMTPDERYEYQYYMKQGYRERNILQYAVSEAKEEGREEGREEANKNTARKMLNAGKYSVADISALTGISPEEIDSLDGI